jgi:hypothetical protein
VTFFLAGVATFLVLLVVLGLIADWIDGDERRDSRRRNR